MRFLLVESGFILIVVPIKHVTKLEVRERERVRGVWDGYKIF